MLPIDRATHERVITALPAGLRGRAESGWEAFQGMEMPVERDENWRYVDPDFDLSGFGIAETPGDPLPPLGVVEASARATSVDGTTVDVSPGADVAVRRLADVDDDTEVTPEDRIVAMHEAFSGDGVEIEVPSGKAPGEVLVEMQAVTEGVAAFPRIRVRAGEGSDARVTVIQRSPDDITALVVPRFEVWAAQSARVTVTVVQLWGDRTTAAARHHLVAGRDSSVALAEGGFGGEYSRLHLTVDLVGEGSSANIAGAYFGDRDQTLDYRYFMRHAARSTTSEMFLKGAVGDDASSVFSGLIRIEKEGQKTSAHQTNRNLVLSDGAEAHSVPNLEILADDVRCGHGSAVGPLDVDQRYYLMSRGLERARADRLQVKGFFEDALTRFSGVKLQEALRNVALDKYARVTG